jgi:general secretion pathway protein N
MKKRYILALCTTVVTAVIVINAPAAWLSPWVMHYSQGKVSFERSWGTIWQGTAELRIHRSSKESLLVPHPIHWDLGLRLFDSHSEPTLPTGLELNATVKSAALTAPIQLAIKRSLSVNANSPIQLTASSGQYQLPMNTLNSLGAPFNTLKLKGNVSIAWGEINHLNTLKRPPVVAMTLLASQLRTVVTGEEVLGDYELRIKPSTYAESAPSRLDLILSTRQDITPAPTLLLNGTGSVNSQGSLQFELHAKTNHTANERLNALLSFLGRREGDENVLRIQ